MVQSEGPGSAKTKSPREFRNCKRRSRMKRQDAGHRRAGIRPRNCSGNQMGKHLVSNSKEAEFILGAVSVPSVYLPALCQALNLSVTVTAASKRTRPLSSESSPSGREDRHDRKT